MKTNDVKDAIKTAAFVVLIVTLTACGAGVGISEQPQPAATSAVPTYQTVSTEDLSYSVVRRIQVRVTLPEHYSRSEIETISRAVVADVTRKQDVNAISILFYSPNSATDAAWDIASVDWAPNGQWTDAGKVQTGNYQSFRYSVSYNPPHPTETTLLLSGKTGLSGAPLPKGAQLEKRTAGDPASGIDSKETYEVAASAAEIIAFYEREMPRVGWKKTGPFEEYYLFFEKVSVTLLVYVNRNGGSFTLMGS